ncbi:MAG: DUF4124 domain-containing protein [Gammaproteobacteria bacterium]|nr:DUF4124 domain-containing protein [Gammaproteobacteria bacterium]
MRISSMVLSGTASTLLIFSIAAQAGSIHRCVGEHGEVAYSHQPCGTPIDTRIAPVRGEVEGAGLRPGEKALLRQLSRRAPDSRPARRAARRQDTAKKEYACRQKQRALDAVRATLRRGYKPGRGEKLRRRRRAYEDYLSTFCS